MIFVIRETSPRLIHAFYLTAGTHTLYTRLAGMEDSATVVARLRLADSFTDIITTSVSLASTSDDEDVVVGTAARYELYADISSGSSIGILEATIL